MASDVMLDNILNKCILPFLKINLKAL
uniref:Uncharacterized protein n=1 Tax=Anguilla anguilla TaxID=7936 RepID=A0A0E9S8E1_ANGAN